MNNALFLWARRGLMFVADQITLKSPRAVGTLR